MDDACREETLNIVHVTYPTQDERKDFTFQVSSLRLHSL